MTNKDIYKIWAPTDKKWVDWVRPVPFIAIDKNIKRFRPMNFTLPVSDYLKPEDKNIAIIVDLPGTQSVEIGILLAQHGYRPIPVYNGVVEQKNARATTDDSSISSALVWGASKLTEIDIKDDANPAFLVDSNRMHRFKMDISIFDNSWDLYFQDIPSEKYLMANGIERVLVISNELTNDLKRIFANYDKKEIKVLWTNGYEAPKQISYKSMLFASKLESIMGKEG